MVALLRKTSSSILGFSKDNAGGGADLAIGFFPTCLICFY